MGGQTAIWLAENRKGNSPERPAAGRGVARCVHGVRRAKWNDGSPHAANARRCGKRRRGRTGASRAGDMNATPAPCRKTRQASCRLRPSLVSMDATDFALNGLPRSLT